MVLSLVSDRDHLQVEFLILNGQFITVVSRARSLRRWRPRVTCAPPRDETKNDAGPNSVRRCGSRAFG